MRVQLRYEKLPSPRHEKATDTLRYEKLPSPVSREGYRHVALRKITKSRVARRLLMPCHEKATNVALRKITKSRVTRRLLMVNFFFHFFQKYKV